MTRAEQRGTGVTKIGRREGRANIRPANPAASAGLTAGTAPGAYGAGRSASGNILANRSDLASARGIYAG